MAGHVKPIPVPVILAAVNGDENALAAVVAHYQKYIRALATRPVRDEYGNEYLYVDEDMRLRLETKLIGNLSSQVQQQIGKDFRGGVPVEAFARTMIQLFCKLGQSLCRKRNLIGVFGNVLPQQAVDLLV